GAILAASLWAGTTIVNSGGRAAIATISRSAGATMGPYRRRRNRVAVDFRGPLRYWNRDNPVRGERRHVTQGVASKLGGVAADGSIARLVAAARRRPGRTLAVVLALHLVVWTLLPILLCPNLQLDLVEDLALGKEWQLGYWKHPPLPWWTADLLYRLSGQLDAIYVLGPLAAVACFYAVWLLAREVTSERHALIAVLALEGIHFYNFSVVKFAHDQMQLPFWAFTALFFYRALVRGRLLDWALAGAFLAGAFWSKYAAFALAAALGLFLLGDPFARRAGRTPGPFLLAAAVPRRVPAPPSG